MYGSLVTVWTGRRPTIVIGDPKVARDLLDRRSAIYSSRPRFVIMGKLFSSCINFIFANLGFQESYTRITIHSLLCLTAINGERPARYLTSDFSNGLVTAINPSRRQSAKDWP